MRGRERTLPFVAWLFYFASKYLVIAIRQNAVEAISLVSSVIASPTKGGTRQSLSLRMVFRLLRHLSCLTADIFLVMTKKQNSHCDTAECRRSNLSRIIRHYASHQRRDAAISFSENDFRLLLNFIKYNEIRLQESNQMQQSVLSEGPLLRIASQKLFE